MRNSVGGLYRIARPGSTSPAREPLDRIPIALPLDLANTAIGADQLGALGGLLVLLGERLVILLEDRRIVGVEDHVVLAAAGSGGGDALVVFVLACRR